MDKSGGISCGNAGFVDEHGVGICFAVEFDFFVRKNWSSVLIFTGRVVVGKAIVLFTYLLFRILSSDEVLNLLDGLHSLIEYEVHIRNSA